MNHRNTKAVEVDEILSDCLSAETIARLSKLTQELPPGEAQVERFEEYGLYWTVGCWRSVLDDYYVMKLFDDGDASEFLGEESYG